MTIPAALDRALARLGVAASDREADAEYIKWALRQAATDHAAYAAWSSKGRVVRLKRIGALASQAAGGDTAALARLRDEVGDGADIDALLVDGLGGACGHYGAAASSFARSTERDAAFFAGVLMSAADLAARARPRRRREAKFFAVLALAFVFVDITGEAPSFTTAKDTDDRDDGGARMGRFAEFVNAADLAFGIPGGDAGFDATIPAALRVGRAEIALHAAMTDRPWPAPFGSPSFVLEASDDEGPDAA